MKVPFVDLHAQYLTIKAEIDEALNDVIKHSTYIRGPQVEEFERAWASKLGMQHCVSCANGTDALYIAMRALGVKAGDEVITTAHSWISTSETITQTGAQCVFSDTDDATFTLDPTQIESKITERTVGIIVVHLYGQSADMDPILEIARKRNLWVLEDCAQAHLARYKGRLVGTFGVAATYSFYPGKNLGAYGDAGAIVTNDARLAEWMCAFARHGGKGEHVMEGINSRMDGLQGAVLNVKLRHLDRWTNLRKQIAATYNQLLSDIPAIRVPSLAPGRDHVYHLYVIIAQERDQLKSFLQGNGIETVLNYPVALPFLPAYSYLRHAPSDFPRAFSNQSRILSLPMYPEFPDESQTRVCKLIAAFYSNK